MRVTLERRVAVALAPGRQHDGQRTGVERAPSQRRRRAREVHARSAQPVPPAGRRPRRRAPRRRAARPRGGRPPCAARARRRRGSSGRAGRGGAVRPRPRRGPPPGRGPQARRGRSALALDRARTARARAPRCRPTTASTRAARRASARVRASACQSRSYAVKSPGRSTKLRSCTVSAIGVPRADRDRRRRRQPHEVDGAGDPLEPRPPDDRTCAVQHPRRGGMPHPHDVRAELRGQRGPAWQHHPQLDIRRERGQHPREIPRDAPTTAGEAASVDRDLHADLSRGGSR